MQVAVPVGSHKPFRHMEDMDKPKKAFFFLMDKGDDVRNMLWRIPCVAGEI